MQSFALRDIQNEQSIYEVTRLYVECAPNLFAIALWGLVNSGSLTQMQLTSIVIIMCT